MNSKEETTNLEEDFKRDMFIEPDSIRFETEKGAVCFLLEIPQFSCIEKITEWTAKLNCTTRELAEHLARVKEKGVINTEVMLGILEKQHKEKLSADLEGQKKEYLEQENNKAYMQGFINGIVEGTNTPAISTGFEKLDKALDGGLYEGLHIIGGLSSLGKTTLVLQIADQIAQQGKDVLIVSLEMARNELMAKSISRHTIQIVERNGMNTNNAKTNRGITDSKRWENYNETECKLIDDAVKEYYDYSDHIFVIEGDADMDVKRIRDVVEKHKVLTGNSPVVFIDYLQIMKPYDVRATDKQSIDYNVKSLKKISVEFKTPVIAISSFGRSNYNGEAQEESFKESGGIEYTADVLIGLNFYGVNKKKFNRKEAKKKFPREIELSILKQRNAATGEKVSFNFYTLFNRFEETEAREEDEE